MTWLLQYPSRRAFVFGLMAIAVPSIPTTSGVLPLRKLRSPSPVEARRRARALVDATTSSRDSAARIGRHYLRMVPNEQNIETLLALIDQRLPDTECFMKDASFDQIHKAIAKSVQNDFACGRISRVQGWMLSRTEARVAALAALI